MMMDKRERWIGALAAGGAVLGGAYLWRRTRQAPAPARTLHVPLDEAAALVEPLARFGASDISRAGGKGAHLGELLRAGFPVPPGFVVTTRAYEHFIERAGLHAQLAAALTRIDPADLAALEHDSATIREAFLAASIAEEVAAPVRAHYAALGGGAVAVRSSATTEDLSGTTAAGQQETLLDIRGTDALLDALRHCWASLWTARAIAYRAHQGLDTVDASMAVVVQRMVAADAAGVVFTVDPVSGARRHLVINAAPGLGEALVAGRITPDHLVVRRRGLRIVEQRLAHPGRPVLPADAVRELSRIALAVERHFRTPQDIEWAWAERQFAVLQARPITNLAQVAAQRPRARDAAAMAGDRLPMRPYPIDLYFLGTFSRALYDALFGTFGLSAPSSDAILSVEDGVVAGMRPTELRLTPRVLYKPWVSMWRSRRYDPARFAEDPVLLEAQRRARELAARDLSTLPWAELVRMAYEVDALVPLTADLRRRYFPRLVPALIRYMLLLRLAGQSQHSAALLTGVRNKTIEIIEALEDLAQQIRDDLRVRQLFAETDVQELLAVLRTEPAAERFLQRFTAFLRVYGQREYVIFPSQGAWRNRPEVPLAMLKSMAAAEAHAAEKAPEAWEQARDAVLRESVLGHWLLRRHFLRTLEQVRFLAQIREDTHYYLLLHLPLLHDVLIAIGSRLATVGVLDAAHEVVHLQWEEIAAITTWPPDQPAVERLHTTVKRRAEQRVALGPWRAGTFTPLPAVLDRTALLAGIGVSPGTAVGPVRVVSGPAEFAKVRPGDVLVARYTDPTWTPLFTRVVAVVADSGGTGSHAAIVAREYGVPAVLGTAEATQRLQDDQHVLVDGNRGLVLPASEAAAVVG